MMGSMPPPPPAKVEALVILGELVRLIKTGNTEIVAERLDELQRWEASAQAKVEDLSKGTANYQKARAEFAEAKAEAEKIQSELEAKKSDLYQRESRYANDLAVFKEERDKVTEREKQIALVQTALSDHQEAFEVEMRAQKEAAKKNIADALQKGESDIAARLSQIEVKERDLLQRENAIVAREARVREAEIQINQVQEDYARRIAQLRAIAS